jgi:hypothetical protein
VVRPSSLDKLFFSERFRVTPGDVKQEGAERMGIAAQRLNHREPVRNSNRFGHVAVRSEEVGTCGQRCRIVRS